MSKALHVPPIAARPTVAKGRHQCGEQTAANGGNGMIRALAIALVLGAASAEAACPGQTQNDMNRCAHADLEQADAALNAAWGPAKSFMDARGHGDVLLDAQRKWLAFRDAACTAEIAPYAGGSIQPLIWYSCLARLTRARTQDLYNFRF